jgi:hypothetical protein
MVPPPAPSFGAAHRSAEPGLPAGKASLRPQRSMHGGTGLPVIRLRSDAKRLKEPSRGRASGRLQGSGTAAGGGSERQDSAPAESCSRTKEAHRVGLASVQLTRSTFAEATAGRESLQPSALRARCTRKVTGSFRQRQEPVKVFSSQIATFRFRNPFRHESRMRREIERKKTPSPLLPRPTFRPTAAEADVCRRAISLRRSVLGALGTLGPREDTVKRLQSAKSALCELSLQCGRVCVERCVL